VSVALETRPRLRVEIWLVLGLSLLRSAVYSIYSFIQSYQSATPVGQQNTTLHRSLSDVPVWDLIRQLTGIVFSVVPVLLAFYLLSAHGASAMRRLGLVWPRRARDGFIDLGHGAMLAAAIGIPGLGLYVLGRAIGQTVRIDTSGLPEQWWTALVLVLAAVAIALLEEVIAVGFLITRLRDLAWHPATAIVASALLRGSYHLYQGWPMALGNFVMGLVFATYFAWKGRLGPLLAAHALLDLVSFLGPELAPDSWLTALRLA
jgi:membrane protease YdiL (CAAX protease family)